VRLLGDGSEAHGFAPPASVISAPEVAAARRHAPGALEQRPGQHRHRLRPGRAGRRLGVGRLHLVEHRGRPQLVAGQRGHHLDPLGAAQRGRLQVLRVGDDRHTGPAQRRVGGVVEPARHEDVRAAGEHALDVDLLGGRVLGHGAGLDALAHLRRADVGRGGDAGEDVEAVEVDQQRQVRGGAGVDAVHGHVDALGRRQLGGHLGAAAHEHVGLGRAAGEGLLDGEDLVAVLVAQREVLRVLDGGAGGRLGGAGGAGRGGVGRRGCGGAPGEQEEGREEQTGAHGGTGLSRGDPPRTVRW
jgi:hypothetical protein